jgi:hypothetical protein
MRTILVAAVLLLSTGLAASQEKVKESSTGKEFPSQVSIVAGGKETPVQLTGVAVRKKLVFKVYGMAHYMESAPQGKEEDVLRAILTDGKAKQITMEFVRDVDASSIQNAYRDGFKEHASGEELKALQPLIDKFIAYFTREVKENDRLILRWLPGGTIIPIIQGEEKPAITDERFARTLWSIWFGESSIVDRDDLIERLVK